MKQLALLVLLTLSCAAPAACQSISGHSTIDIDPNTSTVTATCETNVDGTTEGAYDAQISCSVVDGSGTSLGSDYGEDDGTGHAEVTISFTGTPGTTYTLTGRHSAYAYLDFGEYYGDQPIQRGWWDDPFNFFSFSENPGNYFDNFILEGPGPEQEVRNRNLQAANTTARAYLPGLPFAMQVFTDSGNQRSTTCPAGQNYVYRNLKYQMIDMHGANVNKNYLVWEEVSPPNSTCNGQPVDLGPACGYLADSTGKFPDELTTGYCSTNPNKICGFSLIPDVWKACSNNTHIKIGTPTYVVQWNIITIDGSTSLSSGTPLPNQ